jgi:serine/threonine protein kinase
MHARFMQEGRMGLKLHHPHIVETYHLGSAGGLPYMVMEFVRGPSLLEVLQRCGPIKWTQACEFARQAALGLDYAHQHGVIHRDVKPQNLLVDQQGQIRLLDFGLSMVKEGETGDEFSMAMIFGHESVGTAEFSAPEQASDSLAADARSDVYSLGGSLYTMLTGTTPYQGKTVAEMLRAHRHNELRSVREHVKTIPQGVADVVAKMLAKKPDDRYATAAEAAAALAEFAKAGPVSINFDVILADRKQQAQKKLAQLSKARSTPSGLRGSTARPTTISSVTAGSSPTNGGGTSGVQLETAELPPQSTGATVKSHRRSGQPIESAAVLTAVETDAKFPLKLDQIILGRKEDCDLSVPENSVSSRHCELRFDGFHWWVTDLNSRNGTLVNGVPIQQQLLKDGDIIQIGSTRRFRLDATGVERVAQPASRGRGMTLMVLIGLAVLIVAAIAFVWLSRGSNGL